MRHRWDRRTTWGEYTYNTHLFGNFAFANTHLFGNFAFANTLLFGDFAFANAQLVEEVSLTEGLFKNKSGEVGYHPDSANLGKNMTPTTMSHQPPQTPLYTSADLKFYYYLVL